MTGDASIQCTRESLVQLVTEHSVLLFLLHILPGPTDLFPPESAAKTCSPAGPGSPRVLLLHTCTQVIPSKSFGSRPFLHSVCVLKHSQSCNLFHQTQLSVFQGLIAYLNTQDRTRHCNTTGEACLPTVMGQPQHVTVAEVQPSRGRYCASGRNDCFHSLP